MTDTTAFDWRSFLLRWSGEWADSVSDDDTRSEDDEAARRTRRLGFPPACEGRIAAMEKRLGRRMPPSYREFLKVSGSYDDRALMAVGRAGTGWSFACDGHPAPFDRRRFVSPAAGASGGTRAVVVWSELRAGHRERSFHLSVARDGVEQYAFTYADGKIGQSGEIPRTLDPSLFFGERADGAGAERSLLDAVATEFGVRLPRHAIVNGRLHTFVTRSWTRPPRDGEGYMVMRIHGTAPTRAGGDPSPEEGPQRR